MNTSRLLRVTAMVGVLTLLPLAAADAPAIPDAIKNLDGADIALDFFQAQPKGDATAWAQFLKDNDIAVDSDAAKAAEKILGALQKTAASGVGLSSKRYFWTRVERILGTKVDAVAAPEAPKPPPPFSTDEQKKYNDLQTKLGHDQALADRYAEEERKAKELALSADKSRVVDYAANLQMLAAQKQKQAYADLVKQAQGQIDQLNAQRQVQTPGLSPAAQEAARTTQLVAAGKVQAQAENLVLTTPKLPILDVESGGLPFYVMIGTRATTPYSISDGKTKRPDGTDATPKGTIDTSASTLRPFLEIGYTTFWAMDAEHKAAWPGPIFLSDPHWRKGVGIGNSGSGFDWWSGVDVDAHLNLLFNESDKTSATTGVGSGDINTELNVDKLLYAAATDQVAWTVALGTRVGGSASRSDRKVHPDYFLGPRFNLSHVVVGGTERRMSLFRFGLGVTRVDALRYDTSVAPPNSRVLFNGDVPVFDGKWVPAFEAELIYPVSSAGFVKLGTRLYSQLDPNPWTIYIGYTINTEDLFKSLVGFRKNNEPTPAAQSSGAATSPPAAGK